MASALRNQLAENARRVRARIAEAALRIGREPSAVRVVAVTKYVDAETAGALCEAGERDLGENRVQELEAKAVALAARAPTWHLIGSLQTNKVAKALRHASWIHSVDRAELWDEIERRTQTLRVEQRPRLLLQVNVSGETSKHGFEPDALRRFLLERAPAMRAAGLYPAGLMTMAPLAASPEIASRCFVGLHSLGDELRARGAHLGNELSMGMSQDFEIALAAGATVLRIGSAFFERVA